MGTVSFSPARPDDAASVHRLVRAAYEPYVERIGREPAPMAADYTGTIEAGHVRLARDDSQMIGVLVCEPHPDHLLIENIAVAAEAQGNGVGALLLDEAETEARRLGLSELRLYTNAKMTENLAYYPRRGFRETGRRIENGYDRVYFSRHLI
ncbi:MAG: GNAT family N-acetyltransferase [Leucobacter sp.]